MMLGRLFALLVLAAVAWLLYDLAQQPPTRVVDVEKGGYKGIVDAPLPDDTRRALGLRARDAVEPTGRLSP